MFESVCETPNSSLTVLHMVLLPKSLSLLLFNTCFWSFKSSLLSKPIPQSPGWIVLGLESQCFVASQNSVVIKYLIKPFLEPPPVLFLSLKIRICNYRWWYIYIYHKSCPHRMLLWPLHTHARPADRHSALLAHAEKPVNTRLLGIPSSAWCSGTQPWMRPGCPWMWVECLEEPRLFVSRRTSGCCTPPTLPPRPETALDRARLESRQGVGQIRPRDPWHHGVNSDGWRPR